jgi:hypothetical protein
MIVSSHRRHQHKPNGRVQRAFVKPKVKETGYDRGWILSRRLVDRRDCNKRKIGRYHDVIKS